MMDDKKFDQWANAYEDDVFHSDKENTYPFAGYRKVLGYIYDMVMQKRSADVLELGFGTGVLTNKLYEGGCTIYGQDFSKTMIRIAGKKMPISTREIFPKGWLNHCVKESLTSSLQHMHCII